jgi:hypothetical protein
MEKGRKLLRWTGVIAVSTVLLVLGAAAYGIEQAGDKEALRSADIIVIDTMSRFGRLDRPPVVYRHDKHTEALQKQGKDCAACHRKDDKQRLSHKFLRLEDLDRESTMRVYHDNCIACHTETLATGEKGGPVTCGECHVKSPNAVSSWHAIGMDKSLHYRHVKAQDKKCGQCHHEYDEKLQKLVYVEGKESSCRYCHKEQLEEKRIPFREASHQACIACHQETLAKKKEAGPVNCAGCHDADQQLEIATLETVPRMKRNQPDVVFVKTGAKSSLTPEGALAHQSRSVQSQGPRNLQRHLSGLPPRQPDLVCGMSYGQRDQRGRFCAVGAGHAPTAHRCFLSWVPHQCPGRQILRRLSCIHPEGAQKRHGDMPFLSHGRRAGRFRNYRQA